MEIPGAVDHVADAEEASARGLPTKDGAENDVAWKSEAKPPGDDQARRTLGDTEAWAPEAMGVAEPT